MKTYRKEDLEIFVKDQSNKKLEEADKYAFVGYYNNSRTKVKNVVTNEVYELKNGNSNAKYAPKAIINGEEYSRVEIELSVTPTPLNLCFKSAKNNILNNYKNFYTKHKNCLYYYENEEFTLKRLESLTNELNKLADKVETKRINKLEHIKNIKITELERDF